MLFRNVANFASAGFVKQDEFNSAWPLPDRFKGQQPGIDFNSAEYKEWYANLKKKINLD